MHKIHPVIQDEINRIKMLLKKRGLSPLVEDHIQELGGKEKFSKSDYPPTENVCILSTASAKSKNDYNLYLLTDDPSKPDHFISTYCKAWCAVLPDPGNSCDDRWENMLDDIIFHLFYQGFDGFVLVRCPKMTSYGTALGWYEDLLHIDGNTEKVHRIKGISLKQAYPHCVTKKS